MPPRTQATPRVPHLYAVPKPPQAAEAATDVGTDPTPGFTARQRRAYGMPNWARYGWLLYLGTLCVLVASMAWAALS